MARKLSFTSQVRVRDAVVFRDLEGEAVLLNLESGVYFGLDPVGTRIWHFLVEPCTLQKILDVLVAEYEVTKGECAHDLLRFIGQLRENELIEISD